MSHVHLLARDNGVGLSQDLAVLAQTLARLDCEVSVTGLGHRAWTNRVRRFGRRTQLAWRGWREGRARGRYDVNLMLERIRPEFFELARRNVLLPNPEWFVPEELPLLPAFDRVFAKTEHACAIFSSLDCRTELVHFSTPDKWQPEVVRERRFFHLAGRSANKGTRAILDLWLQHPDWPQLTVVQSRRGSERVVAANIDHRLDYLPEAQLRQLQNACVFHLCPSETEGWGHYLVEALSVGAVTLTLDAPPMNELVRSDRGLLAGCAATTGVQRLATTYFVDPLALEKTVERTLALSAGEISALGANARAWYENNQRAFESRLAAALAALD